MSDGASIAGIRAGEWRSPPRERGDADGVSKVGLNRKSPTGVC
jgi:hypothetical protein